MWRVSVFIVFILVASCAGDKGTSLFNGKDLSGWDTYVAPDADSLPTPGLNNDPDKVFSVVMVDNEPAIRISGEHFGGLSTVDEFENYHLTIEFKWGVNKIPSFKDRKRDSGILYHAVGPHGMDAKSWMRSQEFQVQETDCGDYWGVAGGLFDITASQNEKGEWIYDPLASMVTFSATSPAGRRCIKLKDAETPGWNTLEVFCYGGNSVHVVNGVVVMRLSHSQQEDNGAKTPLTKGKIQLQSEGCEVYYRHPVVHSIDRIPDTLVDP